MHKESIVMGVAGLLLGVMVGWIIGSQAGTGGSAPTAAAPQAASAPAQGQQPAQPLDQKLVDQLRVQAEAEPKNADVREQLGNLYFDAEQYNEAVRWYTDSLSVDPNDPNVSTDLGIAYYYTNQVDRALQQFDRSLEIDPRHTKTLLNIGVVRAWGKQDLEGAAKAWERVIEVAPGSEEAARAKQGLDGIRSAGHPGAGGTSKGPGSSN